jgi:single-strand DNA-binding protein
MSANFNSITLVGNLTKDPKLEFTSGGKEKGTLRIAVNRKFKKGTELVDAPLFIDVEVWEKQATSCSDYLKMGMPVLVSGQLQRDEWTGKDNEPHEKWYVNAHVVQFLSNKPSAFPKIKEDEVSTPTDAEIPF